MMPSLREIPCDVCGADEPRFVGFQPGVSPAVSALLPEAANLPIVKCRRCGSYYTRPTVFWTASDLDVLYAHDYFPEPLEWWDVAHTRGRREVLDRLHGMAKCDAPTFLDMGCGLGEVLVEACKLGWQTFGIDASTPIVERAQANLQALGFSAHVLVATVEDSGLPSAYFDLLQMHSVLEHLPQPSKAVREVWRLLKPGGLASILVPNEDRFAYLLDDSYLRLKQGRQYTCRLSPFNTPYHLVGFTPSSLKLICERSGFVIRYLKVYRSTESWRRFGESELNFRGRLFRCLQQAFWTIGGLLGRGAIIEVIVQKI